MYIFFWLWSLVEFKNRINPWLRFDYIGGQLKLNLGTKTWKSNGFYKRCRCLCPSLHTSHLFFANILFFASKSNIKGQPRSLNLDFLSKNVSNYETNAVLPKTVKGISSCQQNLIKTFKIEAMIGPETLERRLNTALCVVCITDLFRNKSVAYF